MHLGDLAGRLRLQINDIAELPGTEHATTFFRRDDASTVDEAVTVFVEYFIEITKLVEKVGVRLVLGRVYVGKLGTIAVADD